MSIRTIIPYCILSYIIIMIISNGRILYTTEEMPTHSLKRRPTFFKRSVVNSRVGTRLLPKIRQESSTREKETAERVSIINLHLNYTKNQNNQTTSNILAKDTSS